MIISVGKAAESTKPRARVVGLPAPRRPLALCALGFAAGIACRWFAGWGIAGAAVLAAAIILTAALFIWRGRFAWLRAPAVAFVVGFALLSGQLALLAAEGNEGYLRGRVCELPARTQSGVYFMLDDLTLDGQPLRGKARLFMAEGDYACGDVIELQAKLNTPRSARNAGGNDGRITLWSRNARWSVSARSDTALVGHEHSPMSRLLELRAALVRTVDALYPEREAGVVKAMLFGEKGGMDDEWTDAFYAVGVAHIFAVSGLHVGVIAGALLWLFGRLRLRGGAAFAALALLLAAYAVFAGFSPSVLRASLMCLLLQLVRWQGEHYDLYTALGASALVILAINPMRLLTASFLMSYGAVLGIAAFASRISGFLRSRFAARGFGGKALRWLWASVGVSLSATLGVLPFQLLFFGTVSPLSLLANLLTVPVASAAIVLALISAVLGTVWLPLGLPFAAVTFCMIRTMAAVSELFAAVPFAQLVVGSRPLFAAALGLGLLAMALRQGVAKRVWLSGALACGALGVAFLTYDILTPRVTVLDVGQGAAVHVSWRGVDVLVDGGNAEDFDNGQMVLLPYFRSQGITKLDAVIATHPHADHAGGLVRVVEQMDVRYLLGNGRSEDIALYHALLTMARAWGKEQLPLWTGDELSGRGMRISVLHPTAGEEWQGNDASLVLRFALGERALLLTGDATERAERAIIDAGLDASADVLQCGHHGSKGSSTEEFLRAVEADYAFVCVGANVYGHPTDEALARLHEAGVQVSRTDEQGMIRYYMGRNIRVTTMLGE